MKRHYLSLLFGALGWFSALHAQSLLGNNPTLPQIHAQAMSWADFDLDGDLDLFAAGLDSLGQRHTYLLRNDPAGGPGNNRIFVSISHPFPALAHAASAWGDIDGDGDPDLVITGDTARLKPVTRWYRNNGGASFTAMTLNVEPIMTSSIGLADFDGDGDLDMVLSGWNPRLLGSTKLLINNGLGVFTQATLPMELAVTAAHIVVGDLEGDGDQDVLISGRADNEDELVMVMRNLGALNFEIYQPMVKPVQLGNFSWADFDLDGDLDFLGTGYSSSKSTTLYRNQAGLLQPYAGPFPPLGHCFGAWFNFDPNQNALPDLALAGDTDSGAVFQIYRNTGTGFVNLQPSFPLPSLIDPVLSWADWNLDGYGDLAASGIDANGRYVFFLLQYNPSLQRFVP